MTTTSNNPRSAPPPPPHRRRNRSTSRCSSSSVSSASSAASLLLSPSPSHSSSSSSIPFSWEQIPGIPKSLPKTLTLALPNPNLPLPPPLRPSHSFPRRKKERLAADVDPFAIALAECSKDPPPPESDLWIGTRSSEIRSSRRFSLITGDLLGMLDLYGSCKTSCAVAESTIEIPRVGARRVSDYRVLNRRIG